ncbi:MAG: hypothetical protein J5986_11535 [Roseburia sp.]|nr:hypothetical protein [Roseburia sp.]
MNRAGNERMCGLNISLPMAAGAKIREHCIIAMNEEGFAEEASLKEGLLIAGCSQRFKDNSEGENGEVAIPVRRGTFFWNNDGSITAKDILKDCYVSDAQTVTLTAEGSSRAGKILGVEVDGVIVEML